jgi:hypothetical protein
MGIDNFLMAVLRAEMLAIFVLWSKVMFHYGRAAKAEWIQQGGTRRKLFGEIWHPFYWAYRQFLSRWGVMKPFPKTAYETYTPYTPGVILRFAIWAAALAPAMAFFRIFTPPYYHQPAHTSTLVLSFFLFSFSAFGALAHLYVAHRGNPTRWMHIVVWWTAWMILGPILFYFLWPPPVR